LAPGDQIAVRVLDLEEIPGEPVRLDAAGFLNLPIVGRIPAAGLTVLELQNRVAEGLHGYLNSPSVTITVKELHEEPVTVVGAVNAPGIKQIHGRKTLLEVISEAGGLRPDSGPAVVLTRAKVSGPIPLPGAHPDATGEYSIAEIRIDSLLRAQNPGENIPLLAHDVVTVPPAEMIYVLGEVSRPGGYEIADAQVSVLNAIANAGGANRNASSSHARVLRTLPGSTERTEIIVNLNRMLAGKEIEFKLQPRDILYIPTNKGKVVTSRALEAVIGTGSSIAVFRSAR
jgi:polysaccharide export outer membrane protein